MVQSKSGTESNWQSVSDVIKLQLFKQKSLQMQKAAGNVPPDASTLASTLFRFQYHFFTPFYNRAPICVGLSKTNHMVESVGWFSQVNQPSSSNSLIFSEESKFPHSFGSFFQFFSVFSVSRLAGIDQAIHKLNVGHYTLDVKVSQLIDRLSKLDGEVQNSGRSYSRNTPQCFIYPFFPPLNS